MTIELSAHAQEECQRRNISLALLEQVLQAPQQKLPSYGNRTVYQSQVTLNGNLYLIRAIVDENTEPNRVITVYRTSKIDKYWRADS